MLPLHRWSTTVNIDYLQDILQLQTETLHQVQQKLHNLAKNKITF